MLRIARLPCLLLAIPTALPGAEAVLKTVQGFETRIGDTRIAVQAVAPNILRVVAMPGGKPPLAPHSWSVLPQTCKLSVHVKVCATHIDLQTSGIRAQFDSRSGHIAFMDARGKALFQEDSQQPRSFIAPEDGNQTTPHLAARFRLQDGEPLFGLGQQEDGVMNRRGQKVRLLQSNKRMAVPFLASPGIGKGRNRAAWGLLWDNASHTEFEDGPDGMKLWSDVGEAIVYYVIASPDLDGVLTGLRTLTGPVPLLPKWAFGFWQSKERYQTQAELVGIAEEYRKRKLPLDGVVQDWRYWGKYGWNAMRFDENAFPDPKGMVEKLHSINTRLLISVWPNMETTTEVAKEMAANKVLATPASKTDEGGDLGVYDAFSEVGRQTYWKHLQKGILSTGLDGLWMDATEPEFNAWADNSLLQKTYVAKLKPNAGGSWVSNLNAYPLLTVEGITKNWNESYPDQRPVVLTRSAFLGQGRTGSIVWSGDIPSSFASLKRQIANGLNASLSGLPYWNTDIGGFFPAWFGGEYPKGVRDPAYRELFVRWFQVGAFHPMLRAHGSTTPREIWRFGEPGSTEYEALVRMLKLRYRLLPYLYSTAAELRSGTGTFLRPLGMDFPEAASVQDQFLCGKSLMVSPVMEHQKVLEARQGTILDGNLVSDPNGNPGLRVSYFVGEEPKGVPAKVEQVAQAEFNWNLGLPVGEPGGVFTFRLDGRLKPQAVPQVFTLGCMGGMRAWVDGQLVVDEWGKGPFRLRHVPLNLAKGAEIRIECLGGDSTHLVASLEDAQKAAAPRQGRTVLLPKGAWVDFWTGDPLEGGRSIWKEAALDAVPLHVKAGGILPLGPERQYALEKPEDPLELRVYPGANGRYVLYEDDGTSRSYEEGASSLIPFRWDNKTKVLYIGARKGAFKGMLASRCFRIVLVKPGHGVGESVTETPNKVVTYTGAATKVTLNN